jgi:hypothetical protein
LEPIPSPQGYFAVISFEEVITIAPKNTGSEIDWANPLMDTFIFPANRFVPYSKVLARTDDYGVDQDLLAKFERRLVAPLSLHCV